MRRGINNKGYKDDRNSAIANGNRRKKKKVKIIDLNKIKKTDPNTVVNDVKKLVKAKEEGTPLIYLKSEVLRLRRVVVKEHLQDVIIEKCGRDSLLSLIEMSRKIRDSKKIHDSVDKETEDPPKSRLSILIETQRGKEILGIIKCDRCHRKHSSGYLYTDLNGHEYKVCAYCCKQKIDYSYVIYTPMGNKR